MNTKNVYYPLAGMNYVIDVFAYNNLAIKFYNKQGYHARWLVDIKRL